MRFSATLFGSSESDCRSPARRSRSAMNDRAGDQGSDAMSKWSRAGKIAKGTGKATWVTGKVATRAVRGVARSGTAASAASARALLGGGHYRRSAEQVNERIADALAVADAALGSRDARIAALEARLAHCTCGA